MGFFTELFNGRLHPIEEYAPKSEEYKNALKESGRLREALIDTLSQDQIGLLNIYMDTHTTAEGYFEEEIFRQAFLLGMEMQKEVE
ncbi:MAG: hypothetical protein HFG28_03075 [Eubacterium sp.]|nr:hypothetical protein [Eubacterium sp.]